MNQDSTESSAGGARPFRNFEAIADFQPVVGPEPLRVSGEYHLNRRSGTARLEVRDPPGSNPAELTIDLVIDGSGIGGDWVEVEGRYPAREGQYKTVNIFDRNGDHVIVEVQEVH